MSQNFITPAHSTFRGPRGAVMAGTQVFITCDAGYRASGIAQVRERERERERYWVEGGGCGGVEGEGVILSYSTVCIETHTFTLETIFVLWGRASLLL